MFKNDMMISVVIPIMNEEGNVELLTERLKAVLGLYSNYEIIFVDDGSTDGTLFAIKQVYRADKRFKYLSFSRNFGHQNALKAGLDYAKGDCVISMDGDLQHPPELIPEMVAKWQEGYEVIYTLRQDDPKTGIFKKMTARLFYKLINRLADMEIEQGSADFRLLDRSVVEIVKNLQENPIFFRGLVRWLGFKQYGISYIPQERHWGKTKYSIGKMFKFAVTGITSFSVKPLNLATELGAIIALISFAYGIYAIYIKLFTDESITGWASLLCIISLIGGIQLVTIGVLGEYLGKMFMAQKRRPSYIVREKSDA